MSGPFITGLLATLMGDRVAELEEEMMRRAIEASKAELHPKHLEHPSSSGSLGTKRPSSPSGEGSIGGEPGPTRNMGTAFGRGLREHLDSDDDRNGDDDKEFNDCITKPHNIKETGRVMIQAGAMSSNAGLVGHPDWAEMEANYWQNTRKARDREDATLAHEHAVRQDQIEQGINELYDRMSHLQSPMKEVEASIEFHTVEKQRLSHEYEMRRAALRAQRQDEDSSQQDWFTRARESALPDRARAIPESNSAAVPSQDRILPNPAAGWTGINASSLRRSSRVQEQRQEKRSDPGNLFGSIFHNPVDENATPTSRTLPLQNPATHPQLGMGFQPSLTTNTEAAVDDAARRIGNSIVRPKQERHSLPAFPIGYKVANESPEGSRGSSHGRKSLPSVRDYASQLNSPPPESTITDDHELTRESLVLKDNGTVITEPAMFAGVPLEKINENHPFWNPEWEPLERTVQAALDKWMERLENLRKKPDSMYHTMSLANRQVNRGRSVLDFIRDGCFHPLQFASREIMDKFYKTFVGYDTVFRLINVHEELKKFDLGVTPLEWLRQRLYEIATVQGDKFSLSKTTHDLHYDVKLKALREKHSFGNIGCLSGYKLGDKGGAKGAPKLKSKKEPSANSPSEQSEGRRRSRRSIGQTDAEDELRRPAVVPGSEYLEPVTQRLQKRQRLDIAEVRVKQEDDAAAQEPEAVQADLEYEDYSSRLAVACKRQSMSTGSHGMEWLSDLGFKLETLDTTTNNSTTAKTMIFEWEIPSVFCNQDFSGSGDKKDLRAEIRDFVVLSGSDGTFEATTCARYVEDKFGVAGLEVFDTVVDILSAVNFSTFSPKTKLSSEKTVIRLKKRTNALQVERVSRFCITLTTQATDFDPMHISCIRWLCEALREIPAHPSGKPEPGHRLMKSRVSNQFLELGLGNTGMPSIMAFPLEPLQQLSNQEVGIDCCWVKLFKLAVIAWTPLKHSWGTGLRLSYEMLTRLAAVTNYVCIDSSVSGLLPGETGTAGETTRETTGGLVALGFFTALIPIAYDPATNSTQWHLEVTDNFIIQPEDLKSLKGNWLQVKSPKTFSKSHCYLGWKGNVSVTLGTREGCYDLEWTDLPRVERVFRLEGFEIGGEIGIGDVLPISLKHSGNLSFKACSTVQSFTASAHYEQAIRLLSHHVALIYDSKSQIAWLVPQLSWNLHLCHVWYRHVRSVEGLYDPVPFAEVSTDGSSAACDALHMRSDLTILEGLSFNQLFLQIYRNMASSNRYRQKPKKARIFGTEIMDLIEEPGVGSLLRKLDLPDVNQSWQYLAAKADSISFCKGLGQVLTPQDQGPDHKCSCDTIPSNRSLLVAHNTCIERLLRRESTNLDALQNSIVDLDDGKEWFMKNWPFDTCPHSLGKDYWTTANVSMQRIAKPSRWSMKRKEIVWKGHSTPIPTTGAFVFGNLL